MLNHVTLIGRLGRDPELKMTSGGTPFCVIGVATTERWTKDGEKKEETQWHNLVFWGKNAELAEKYMKKGQLHYFEGSIKYEKYKNKEGVEIYATKIHVSSFKLLPDGSKGSGGYEPKESDAPSSRSSRPGDDSTDYDNDIPF